MKMPRGGDGRGPSRREALNALGLDVAYHRAEGSRLWYGDPGDERAVWDFLGGYGSTFFGHNHPALSEAAVSFLQSRGVIHGQASRRAASDRLVAALAHRLRQSVGRDFEIILANTGTEAVEVAAQHAEEALAVRRQALAERLEIDAPAPLPWSPDASTLLQSLGIEPGPGALQRIYEHNRSVLAEPAVHLALEGSYHGQTARALSLTHDPGRRSGRHAEADHVRFIDPADRDGVDRIVQELCRTLIRVRQRPDALTVEAVPWAPVAAFFIEPIQGEGGIRPVPRDVAAAWQKSCNEHGVPLVADEIQCGMGRTGTFLHAQQLGIRPDYVLLGKSFGGGLAKVCAVAFASDHFLPDFTLRHSSTFAGDDFSSQVAARALELLDEEDALARATVRGESLLTRLRELARRYPSVIRDVRGAGLMLGLEWRALDFDRSNSLDFLQMHGWLGYALSGFLLRHYGVRVAPTLSDCSTLRIEPAYGVPDEAVELLLEGLEELCELLERQDAARILAPCMGFAQPAGAEVELPRRVSRPPRSDAHVGFVGHLITPEDLALWDGNFARLERGACKAFLDRIHPFVEPVLVHRDHVTSAAGETITLTFVGLAIPSDRFHRALRTRSRRRLRDVVQRGVNLAASEGCSVVGLGGYCSIITRNGKDLSTNGLALTTGNGYTVAAGLEAMRETARQLGIEWGSARAAVVGAGGNIGSVVADLLAADVSSLVLIGRGGQAAELGTLAARLAAASGCPVEVGTDPGLCASAQLIVAASNEAGAVLFPEHLSRGPVVINDLSIPSDVHPSVTTERPEARVIRGGVIRTPANPDWSVPGIPLAPGEMYACMTETVLMGLEGHTTHGSYGALTPERVRATLEMASRHGFSSVRTAVACSY